MRHSRDWWWREVGVEALAGLLFAAGDRVAVAVPGLADIAVSGPGGDLFPVEPAGTGRVKLDNEIADVRMLDAIRIAPAVVRAFEAGPDGLEFLVFGPHHEADGEQVDDAWVE